MHPLCMPFYLFCFWDPCQEKYFFHHRPNDHIYINTCFAYHRIYVFQQMVYCCHFPFPRYIPYISKIYFKAGLSGQVLLYFSCGPDPFLYYKWDPYRVFYTGRGGVVQQPGKSGNQNGHNSGRRYILWNVPFIDECGTIRMVPAQGKNINKRTLPGIGVQNYLV